MVITAEELAARRLWAELALGDRVEVRHQVKIGSSADWTTTTTGVVVDKDRRRHGLHAQRNFDDKVFSDVLVLRRDDGELTTVTMDEYTRLRRLEGRDVARGGPSA